MQFFSEQMKSLTDQVFTSKCERSNAVAGLKEHTEQVLTGARTFLKGLSDEHRAMAAQCKSELAVNRRDRSAHVQSFRAEARRGHREASARLRDLLGRSRRDRQEQLNQLMNGFQAVQQELAKDLGEAGRLWRQLGNRRTAAK